MTDGRKACSVMPSGELKHVTWKNLFLKDDQLLVKSLFTDQSYEVLLVDTRTGEAWYERLAAAEILQKSKVHLFEIAVKFICERSKNCSFVNSVSISYVMFVHGFFNFYIFVICILNHKVVNIMLCDLIE